MKRNIYQRLLLSLAMAAFFVTLVSAQVMNRNQLAPEMIEMKKKAKAKGLNAIPAEWTEQAQQARLERIKSERMAGNRSGQTIAKKAIKKPNVEKLSVDNRQNIHERAKQITPPPGYKVGVQTVGGKQYIKFIELPDMQGKAPARVKN